MPPTKNIRIVPAAKFGLFNRSRFRNERSPAVVCMDQEEVEGDAGNRRRYPDFGRVEPVFQLAAVKHQLQGADRHAQSGEAEQIEGFAAGAEGVADEDGDAQRRDKAERQVDIEDPAPAVVLGQPAADDRAADRAEHDADPPNRDRLAVALRRIDLQ
jgi:hypothetical protein